MTITTAFVDAPVERREGETDFNSFKDTDSAVAFHECHRFKTVFVENDVVQKGWISMTSAQTLFETNV